MRILVRPQRQVVLPQSLDDFIDDTKAPALPTPGEPKYHHGAVVVLRNGEKVILVRPAGIGFWEVTDYPDRLHVRNLLEGEILTEITTEELTKIAEYKEKQEDKAERYAELADKAKKEAASTLDRAREMADVIPFGQPILVGHYSEKGDRNFRDRIDRTFKKGFELGEKAEYYAEKAERAADPYAISADDPEATILLKQKVMRLEEERTKVKAMTGAEFKAAYPKGYYEEAGHGIFTPDYVRKLELESLGRRIRDARKRVDALKVTRAIPAGTKEINGVQIVTDQDDNRVKVFFPAKPAQEIIDELKRNGFHWSPREVAWMRQISNAALYEAERIAGKVVP